MQKAKKEEKFVELFDSQMRTFLKYGCHEDVEAFLGKKDEVVARAMEIEIALSHIPFLPVISRTTEVGLDELMKMVHYRDCEGCNFLSHALITNVVDVPKECYFILDVENGKDMIGKSPAEAEKLIKEQERSCLVTEEGITLCVHTPVLCNHLVDCTGSRYMYGCSPEMVPHIYRAPLGGKGAELLHRCAYDSLGWWGSPSCRCRL